MKQVEDLYQGYKGGGVGLSNNNFNNNGNGNSNNKKKLNDDSFVDDEFGDG